MAIVRDVLLDEIRKILVGPNPLDIFKQENGEEILFSDSPLNTYVTGVLFPQMLTVSELQEEGEKYVGTEEESSTPYQEAEQVDKRNKSSAVGEALYAEIVTEAETSKINNYKQSAMGLTVCVPDHADSITINISVGSYFEKESTYPREKKRDDGTAYIEMSEKTKKCFFREQTKCSLVIVRRDFPDEANRYITDRYILHNDKGEEISGLGVAVTYRMHDVSTHSTIYTVTLINTKKSSATYPKVPECWFQVSFSIGCECPFTALPDNFCTTIKDEDYRLNSLLYREVRTYAVGHGCAATWEDKRKGEAPKEIHASVMPEYDVKPIIQGNSAASLSMRKYFSDRSETIKDLSILCSEYSAWIEDRKKEIQTIDIVHRETAEKQIGLAERCLTRMNTGVNLLETDDIIWEAFSLANKAMLMQQIHYKLPLTVFSGYDMDNFELVLSKHIRMPDINDETTWYNPDGQNVYGKWRPFQIAFILMNLLSMSDKSSDERKLVDLIWFPTGGGKTEAYLGLTAFTVLYRRLKNPEDCGTNVIMRYTLRLLTAQQYERAASLMCSLEYLRSENPRKLGSKRITIGLWVGDSLTDNRSSEVIRRIRSVQKGNSSDNISVMLKCPWCGASMETVTIDKHNHTPGYEIESGNQHVLFCCGNPDCDFHSEENPLPLELFDDEIYENPPTLLFGTVDKFATLPFRPQAKSIFGGDGQYTPPELIIQDELHLITGPLGSTVGLYETLINRLCRKDNHCPKIIASTATISHAKQQCNALYNCGEENVFQFPVQGLTYRDNFFSTENSSAAGRKYVGLYGTAASSSSVASIYTFAALLYAAKAIDVEESERDPYWTNLAYFGSMRELGQAAFWYIQDIKERLEVLYQSRLGSSDKSKRRYIYESGLSELTSRMSNSEIPQILKRLEVTHGEEGKYPLDMCLATNMVSVGVDVSRLGLMTVTGQPKSFSEYIQATSRVGRSSKAPGLVFVIFNTSKPRDKSYYEKFQTQHAQLYKSVEPTSVTPFSRPLRERALHAVFVGLHRFYVEESERDNANRYPDEEEFAEICKIIKDRAANIDPEVVDDIQKQLDELWQEWIGWSPSKYEDINPFRHSSEAPLLYAAGSVPPSDWGAIGWKTQMAMRNVDRECQLDCTKVISMKAGEDD